MRISRAFYALIAAAIQNDAAGLGIVGGVKVRLYQQPFTPSIDLDPTTLTEADFNGYTALGKDVAAVSLYVDPATGLMIISLTAAAPGLIWLVGSTANLPQTIYGWGLWTDEATPVFLGSQLIADTQPLVAVGDAVILDPVKLFVSTTAILP